MKRLYVGLLVLTVFISFAFAQTSEKKSEKPGISISRIFICEGIANREPVAVDSVFVGVERVYCFTDIKGAKAVTHVQHIWYRGSEEMARIKLGVRAERWRTFSSKEIIPEWAGDWRVVVLDAEGNKLSQISFQIK